MAISTGANLPAVTRSDLDQARQAYIARLGRPSRFSNELAVEILVRLEDGESLAAICRDNHMPSVSAVYDWKGHISAFAEAFTRARRNAASSLVDNGLLILDDLEGETDKDGNPVPLSMVAVRLAEMRARYRFELAKCFDRETFGDKQRVDSRIQVEHTIGGIIEAISGKTKPLVCLDTEVVPF